MEFFELKMLSKEIYELKMFSYHIKIYQKFHCPFISLKNGMPNTRDIKKLIKGYVHDEILWFLIKE